MVSLVPMTDFTKHLRGLAGTSYTKAVAQRCRVQMRPVAINWNKHQTRPGSQA